MVTAIPSLKRMNAFASVARAAQRGKKGVAIMKKDLRHSLSRWTIYGLALGLTALLPGLSAADHDDDDHDRDRARNGPAVHPPNGERVRPQKVDRELRDLLRQTDDRRIEATI